MNNHIAIIGAGQIGSRHLQGLTRIDRDIKISLVDPDKNSLSMTYDRFKEMPANGHITSVKSYDSLQRLDSDIDIAIIATNADIRRKVVEDLVDQVNVRYLVLEKIAFQSLEDFEIVISLLKKKRIKSWVNCSYRRMYPFYQEIRKEFSAGEKIIFNVSGGSISMACNCIHFLDLFSFFTGEQEIQLNNAGLDKNIIDSKRKGFKEFTGLLRGTSPNGSEFSIMDLSGLIAPHAIQIVKNNAHYTFFEVQEKAVVMRQSDNRKPHIISVERLFQNKLTHLLIQDILDKSECQLTAIQEAYHLHKPILETFLDHIIKTTGQKTKVCPIT